MNTQNNYGDISVQIEIRQEVENSLQNQKNKAAIYEAIEEVRSRGYSLQASYNSERGGAFYDIANLLAQNIQDNSALLTSLFGAAQIILGVLKERLTKQNRAATSEEQLDIKMTVEIDGITTEIKGNSVSETGDAVKKFLEMYPDLRKGVLSTSKIKLVSTISSKQKP